MSSNSVTMPVDKFKLFYSTARLLYSLLVIDLLCEPEEAMQIMALWILLEALTDILDTALQRNAAPSSVQGHMWSLRILNQPSCQSPAQSRRVGEFSSSGESENVGGPSYSRAPGARSSQESRTMFVTFSKGYPVEEWEVRLLCYRKFGDCVESIYMQEVNPLEQALYARVVFKTQSVVDRILNGEVIAKFSIHRKHVWMRKFVPGNGG